jgi:hypothetical protein
MAGKSLKLSLKMLKGWQHNTTRVEPRQHLEHNPLLLDLTAFKDKLMAHFLGETQPAFTSLICHKVHLLSVIVGDGGATVLDAQILDMQDH